ncbi:unnamed protein product [Ceutorhynchus assimilis]|uniref:Chitin deacetylase n=1 Tax=Ceutorhynchus assimilis TaxID=467358 RepID=A0A9N9MHM5_9CUCU|nr:unnamed protein product [Ceutorhynchus assimilis]
MRLTSVFLGVLAISQQVFGAADICNSTNCLIEENCRCSSITSPLALEDTPQLIVLAFVDAAKPELYQSRWSPLIEPRKNPDGDFASATFYVPHEYSDYQIVHDLASIGFEIGVHSVTNDPHQDYWRDGAQPLLEQEFGDQRKIISKFANIPEKYITGTLTPQLQLAGDNSINAFVARGFSYDNSWPSRNRLFPYTLDYATTQICDVGANCPQESHPGFWINPIVDLTSEDGDLCATLAACFNTRSNQTSQEISDWLVKQVETVKIKNRAPLTLIIEEKLFSSVNESWTGLTDALDRIQEDKTVFLVSQSRVIQWLKNPVPVSEFKTDAVSITTGCVKDTCSLKKLTGETRYMVSCVPCPKNYPWLGNPEGV